MAELVVSALLSGFVSVLFERLSTREVLDFLRPKKLIKKLLKKLKVSLLSANKLLDDAEEKQIEDDMVEKWLHELKDVVYKASELTDVIETEALRRKLEGHQSASNVTKMFTKFYELEEILSSLEHLLSQKDALGLEPAGKGNYSGVKTGVSERLRLTPLADESGFCGREDIKEIIIQSLLSTDVCDEKTAVIPITGAGGLGKTTLAQIIYNHPDVEKHFPEARAWITVSTDFDLPTIARKIIRKFSSSSQINGDEDHQELLFKLRDALKGKKFFLVLDDVWSEDHDEWNNLKSCFKSGERGSKIVVTTRSTMVASIAAPNQPHHLLPELPEEDCLKLFAQTVFSDDQDRDTYPVLQEIGKKIVHKCKGNPLSVICVGGILCGDRDPEKWESILKSSVWVLLQQNNKNIIPSLWLSYRHLPSHLKRCFAYCSIFPKDYVFAKEGIVQLWMAEGFLKDEAESTMEEVGNQYFEELKSRSLFQRSRHFYVGERFIMHDLVHDLAMYVSEKFCFWLDEDKTLCDLACETRHLSYHSAIYDVKKFEGLSRAKHLHSFVGLYSPYSKELDILKVLEEFSMEGACLRVLSLSWSKMDSLPDSVGKLKQLRYLNLSSTSVTKLPDSVGALYNLQTLLLSSCSNLTRLPSSLKSLINLHHLDTRGSPLQEMPPKMCNLKKLHTLTDFVLGKQSGSSIKEVGVLQNLHGGIRVSGLQNVNNVDDALEANLKDKKNLSELALEWEGQTKERDSRLEEKVLEALQPHASLKELIISEYGGSGFPHWIGDSLFSKIETVHLINCKDSLVLPALGRLPSLKELKIRGFHRVETIDEGVYSNDSPFRSLKVLHFEDMPEWSCWSFIEDDKDSVFPCLEELKLKGCPQLVGGLPNCNTITTLYIENCPKLELEFLRNRRYGSLKTLSISNCDVVKSIPLDYFPKLNYFTLEDCQNFESFRFAEEPPLVLESLTHLDLRGLPKFVSVPEGGLHAPNLKEFYVHECENLMSPPLQMLLPSNLEQLIITGCKKLTAQVMHWDLQTFTPCLRFFAISGCGEELLDSFPPELLVLPTSLTSLWIEKFPHLKTLNIHAFQHLEDLYVQNCDELQRLPEESLPNSLSSLWINNCPLLERRSLTDLHIENFAGLKTLNIHVLKCLITSNSCFMSILVGGTYALNIKSFVYYCLIDLVFYSHYCSGKETFLR
ncbi:hypothetical protein UlMin_009768 [Ulmus minor]